MVNFDIILPGRLKTHQRLGIGIGKGFRCSRHCRHLVPRRGNLSHRAFV